MAIRNTSIKAVMAHWLALLHPLVIHFPIALLAVALALELLGWLRPSWNLGPTASWNLHLGFLGALAAVITGWFRAQSMGFEPDLKPVLEIHRWMGFATLAATGICVAFGWLTKKKKTLVPWYGVFLAGVVILMGFTAHYGGTLVYGLGYFSEAFHTHGE
jgi:uncharacterized membrane protein